MRAHEKKKLTRLFYANQMKKGLMNDASTGNWSRAAGSAGQHNTKGASHNRS